MFPGKALLRVYAEELVGPWFVYVKCKFKVKGQRNVKEKRGI